MKGRSLKLSSDQYFQIRSVTKTFFKCKQSCPFSWRLQQQIKQPLLLVKSFYLFWSPSIFCQENIEQLRFSNQIADPRHFCNANKPVPFWQSQQKPRWPYFATVWLFVKVILSFEFQEIFSLPSILDFYMSTALLFSLSLLCFQLLD